MSYNPTGNKQWIHHANKGRSHESDFDRRGGVLEILKDTFGYVSSTMFKDLDIPEGGHATTRNPDIYIKDTTPEPTAILLHGPMKNPDKENPSRMREIKEVADYEKAGVKLMVLWGTEDNRYPRDFVIEELKRQGLKVREFDAQKYRERKARCSRY